MVIRGYCRVLSYNIVFGSRYIRVILVVVLKMDFGDSSESG